MCECGVMAPSIHVPRVASRCLDSLLANSSFPATWSVFCGVETWITPADEYDLYADVADYQLFIPVQSAVGPDSSWAIMPTADFLSRFGETGLVPLNLP